MARAAVRRRQSRTGPYSHRPSRTTQLFRKPPVVEISRRFPTTVPIDAGTWSSRVAEELAVTIRALITQWREKTAFSSSVQDKIFHPLYQKVMAKGEVALKYIFEDLQ